jgi:hypothetical protein
VIAVSAADYDHHVADEVRGMIAAFAMTGNCELEIAAKGSTPHIRWGTPDVISLPCNLINRTEEFYLKYVVLHELMHQKISLPVILPKWFVADKRIHCIANTLEDLRVDRRVAIEYAGAVDWISSCSTKTFMDALEKMPVGVCPVVQLLMGLITRFWTGIMPELHPDAAVTMGKIWPAVVFSATIAPPITAPSDYDIEKAFDNHNVSLHPDSIELQTWQRQIAMYQYDWWIHVESAIWPHILELIDKHGMSGLEQLSQNLQPIPCRGISSTERDSGNLFQTQSNVVDKPFWNAVRFHHDTIHRLQEALIDRFESSSKPLIQNRMPTGHSVDLSTLVRFESGEKHLYEQLFVRSSIEETTTFSIFILIDRSSSMCEEGGKRLDASFHSAVILTEVCKRLQMPCQVYCFTTELKHHLDVSGSDDASYRVSISELAGKCRGNTDLALSMNSLNPILMSDDSDKVILFVLTDETIPNNELAPIKRQLTGWANAGIETFVLQMSSQQQICKEFIPVRDVNLLPEIVSGILDNRLKTSS